MAGMKKIKTKDLRPGMKFSKNVYIDQNNILIGPNVPLREMDIKRLIQWGITEVETSGEIIDPGRKYAGDIVSEVKLKEMELKQKAAKYKSGVSNLYIDKKDSLEIAHKKAIEVTKKVFHHLKDNKVFLEKLATNIIERFIELIEKEKDDVIHLVKSGERGDYLYSHCVNVAILSLMIGESLSYSRYKMITLGLGALMHDVGMMMIPAYIVEKEGKLTPEEYNKIKTHPLYGYKMLVQEAKVNAEVGLPVLEHHESMDGRGYPRGLKGNDISEFGRIVAIADTYEAMTKKRSYRDEYISYEAMKSVLSEGQQRFDPKLLRIFLANMAIYPVGSYVQLNNNAICKVVSADPRFPLRPIIQVVYDEFGDKVEEKQIIKLSKEKSLYIMRAVDERKIQEIIS